MRIATALLIVALCPVLHAQVVYVDGSRQGGGDYVAESYFSAANSGLLAKTSGSFSLLRTNYAGGSAPGVNDDSGDGYAKGSQWFYGERVFVCVDETAGAATWVEVSRYTSPLTLKAGSPALLTGQELDLTISSLSAAGLATDAEVSGAVAGVHSPVTLKAGSISLLDGQELDLTVSALSSGGLASDAEVAAAVAGVHAPFALKAGSVGALVGQELEISPLMVADALTGLTVKPITIRAPDGEAMLIESPAGEVIQLIPDDDSGEGTVNVNGAMSITGNVAANGYTGDGSGLANVVPGNGTVTLAKTTITGTPNNTKYLRDDWSWQDVPTPVWSVGWGPGEIVGPFYDGSNDAAGWSRKAEVNGTYPTGIAGMGMSSTLTTLQDVTIYVHRHTPKAATALDTSAAFEITFWTTTASAGDQKFDLVISGSNRSGGGQTTVFTKTGIVGAAGTVTTLVIPVGSVSYLEKSDGTTTDQAESLSSSTLYRMYTFKIVAYSKSSNRVNFVGGVVNGR